VQHDIRGIDMAEAFLLGELSQPAGMLLREIGAIASPDVTASLRPPLVSQV